MDKILIEKGTVQETLIVPLYGRKMCTEMFPELYRDEYADMFPGGRLVFATVGKTGRNLMMKKVLKNMNMEEVKGYFYINNVQKQGRYLKKAEIFYANSYEGYG